MRRDELDAVWDPATDKRLTVWEVTQHLIRALDEGGEPAAADLVRRVGGLADTARDLAYRLYAICERKKWAEEALGYNALVTAWPEITRLAASTPGERGAAADPALLVGGRDGDHQPRTDRPRARDPRDRARAVDGQGARGRLRRRTGGTASTRRRSGRPARASAPTSPTPTSSSR